MRSRSRKRRLRRGKRTPLTWLERIQRGLIPDHSFPTTKTVRLKSQLADSRRPAIQPPSFRPLPPNITKALYAVHPDDSIVLTATFERRSGFWFCIEPPPSLPWWKSSSIDVIRKFLLEGGFDYKWIDFPPQFPPDRLISSGVATRVNAVPVNSHYGNGSVKIVPDGQCVNNRHHD